MSGLLCDIFLNQLLIVELKEHINGQSFHTPMNRTVRVCVSDTLSFITKAASIFGEDGMTSKCVTSCIDLIQVNFHCKFGVNCSFFNF